MTPFTSPVRRRMPAVLALLLATCTLAVVSLATAPAAHAADRNFAPRFSVNDTGDIDIIGNTSMTCGTATACTTAQNRPMPGTTADSAGNGSFTMQYVDVDSDPSTFNSSSATLAMPTGARVLFAGLYWGGQITGTPAQRSTVRLKAPGATTYTTLTANQLDDGGNGFYQGFANVTSLVDAAGNGVWTAADVRSIAGTSNVFAGWSLVVAYHDDNAPGRNLTVFDGLRSINGSTGSTISVSGFQTPPSGNVNATLGFVAYEGDGDITGDSVTVNGKVLSDVQHPATNFFDSRISRGGVVRAGRTPSYQNNMGIDVAMIGVDKTYIPNGATSANIALATGGDVYATGVVTIATDLFAPKIDQTKTVMDLDGGNVEQGDVLEYRIAGTNSGTDPAAGVTVTDVLPADLTYVPGSIVVAQSGTGSLATPRTDAAGDDTAEYDAATRTVRARPGVGSTATTAGNLPVNGSYAIRFRARVNGPELPVADGATITNTARVTFASATLGTSYAVDSSVTSTVASPDLTIDKSHTGTLVRGGDATYQLDVRNVGHAPTQGEVTVTEVLPSGLVDPFLSGPGWDCTAGLVCTRSDALAVGATYPPITVMVRVSDAAPASVANTATVTGVGDGTHGNDSDVDAAPAVSQTDLFLLAGIPAVTRVGDELDLAYHVTGVGPSRSTGSTVTITLPAGLVYVSAPAGCTGAPSSSTVTCAVGPLAPVEPTTGSVRVRVAPGTAGTFLQPTFTLTTNEPDPDPTNNTVTPATRVADTDLRITSSVQGNPSALVAGTTYTWLLDVDNAGGSVATDTVVRFSVSPGLTVDAATLDPRCTLAMGDVVCQVGAVAPGASVPQIAVRATTDAGGTPTSPVTTTATARSIETDLIPEDNEAGTAHTVSGSVDLSTVVTSSATSVDTGDTLTLTATVSNAGPATAATGTVVIDVPTGTTFVSADPGCTHDAAAGTVTCPLGPIAPGGSQARSIVVRVEPTAPATLEASATASTTQPDNDPSNDTGSVSVTVFKVAGLSLVKTVDVAQAAPGDTVTYTLTTSNTGPAAARDVVVTDTLPAGVTLASAPGCTSAGATVTCAIGTVASGASAVVTITATVDPISSVATPAHQLDAVKVETHLSVQAGQTATATAQCPGGYLATDGSVRLDHVDQGTGTFADAHVLADGSTAAGTGWTGTVRNGSTGQLQGKVVAVCVTSRTNALSATDQHDLVVSAPVTSTRTFTAGAWIVDLTCGTGRVAVAPSYELASGEALVHTSQRVGGGWRFVVDVPESAAGTFSVRCLSTSVRVADGHTHDLDLEQLTGTVTVPAGGTVSTQLTCGDTAKGIVASRAAAGLVPLGSDPRPKTREWAFFNPTGAAITAEVGLLCLDTVTGPGTPVVEITNTASVATSTLDATTADDVASATFTATGASGPVRRLAVAPSARVAGRTAALTIASDGGASSIKVVALGKVRGTTIRRGTTLAVARPVLASGSTSVRVRLRADAARAVRGGSLRQVRATVVTPSGSRTVTVRLVR